MHKLYTCQLLHLAHTVASFERTVSIDLAISIFHAPAVHLVYLPIQESWTFEIVNCNQGMSKLSAKKHIAWRGTLGDGLLLCLQ